MSDTATSTAKTKKARYTGAIDLSAPVPATPVKKQSGADLTPYQDTLWASWNKKQANDPAPGFAYTFPEAAISTVKSRFQQAARAMTPAIGVAFETSKPDADGNVRLVVEARTKKAAPAKKTATTEQAPTQAMPKAGGKK